MHNTGNWSKQVGGKVEEDEVYDKNFLKIYSDEFARMFWRLTICFSNLFGMKVVFTKNY